MFPDPKIYVPDIRNAESKNQRFRIAKRHLTGTYSSILIPDPLIYVSDTHTIESEKERFWTPKRRLIGNFPLSLKNQWWEITHVPLRLFSPTSLVFIE